MKGSNAVAVGDKQLRTPKYWPLWLGLALWWSAAKLPYPLLLKVGKLLGTLLHRFVPRRRHIAETNIKLCFPEQTPEQQAKLVKESFHSAGISLLETGMCWWSKKERFQPLCHIEGLEHFDAAMAQGKGVLLLSAHVTSLEIGGRLMTLHRPMHAVYKYHRNPLFEAIMRRGRKGYLSSVIERSDIRGMIKRLKAGETCWYALDQDFGRKNAVFAPFFNIPAATLLATSRIARMTGSPVVPFFPLRLADGSGYKLTILPALDNFPSGNDMVDTTRLNQLIEERVKQTPEQYLWQHRRFKTRPPGEAGVYKKES